MGGAGARSSVLYGIESMYLLVSVVCSCGLTRGERVINVHMYYDWGVL